MESFKKVVYADELPVCDCCEEPFCPKCNAHYADCDCIGPTEDEEEVDYIEIRGEMYARRKHNKDNND